MPASIRCLMGAAERTRSAHLTMWRSTDSPARLGGAVSSADGRLDAVAAAALSTGRRAAAQAGAAEGSRQRDVQNHCALVTAPVRQLLSTGEGRRPAVVAVRECLRDLANELIG